MKVSVIVPYFKKPIKGCLESIENQTYSDIELLAGSEKDFGIKRRKGAGFMRNFLARKAIGQILFFLDADAILQKDAISEMIKIFEKEKVDALSSLPVAPRRSKTDLLNWLLGLEYEDRIKKMGEGYVNVFATTGLGIKKSVFKKMGGFVETYKGGIGEDWHLSTRMSRTGYLIWHSNKVKIFHYPAQTVWKYLKKQFYHAWYRPKHYKDFKQTTESYTNLGTIIQPFLWIIFPILPLIFWLIFLWDIGKVWKFSKKTQNSEVFWLLPLSAIRSLVWFFGVLKGTWDFILKPKIWKMIEWQKRL